MKIHEKDIFIITTTACNLKCFSCGYGCSEVQTPWYITEEEFKNVLIKIKNTHIDNCQKYAINITGGEVLLHPQWLDFAKLTREILPEHICYIATNGLLFNQIPDEVLLYCYNNGIKMGTTLYPLPKLLPMYLEIEERLKRLKLNTGFFSWNSPKIMFGKQCITSTRLDTQECYKTTLESSDYCFIYKNKIYNCQTAFYQEVLDLNKNFGTPIEQISSGQNLKELPVINCPTCQKNIEETILWHLNSEVPNGCLSIPLRELYLNDYNTYYILQHDCKRHLECLKHDFFQKHLRKEYFYDLIQTRFFDGKIDIFIPFDDYINPEFKELLMEQSIIDKCNIYLVSYTDDNEINNYVYKLFYLPLKNFFFLRSSEYLNSIHAFLENSYIDNKYALDIKNYDCLKEPTFLETKAKESTDESR